MLIKTTMRHHLIYATLAIIKKKKMSVGEDVRKKESLCTVGGSLNWCSYYEKLYGVSSES